MKERAEGIYSARYRWTSLGAFALVFLNAFQTLAVTTIMPLVSDELDGAHLYALAFAAPLAAGVVGMVVGGNWADRAGPAPSFFVSAVLFAAGLVIAGIAPTMEILVLGRLVLGLGGGAVTVALYVLVARVFPASLHPKVFAGFATSWVVPAIVGPAAAGFVAQELGWRWVFLGVVVLVFGAGAMVLPSIRALPAAEHEHPPPWRFGRIGWSILVALAVLAVSVSAEAPGAAAPLLALAAAVIAIVAARPLLPTGTLAAARGLPAVVLLRGFIAAAFFGAEVYIPYLLIAEYGWTPAIAGLALTTGVLSWATASHVQGRYSERISDETCLRLGTAAILVSTLVAFATALWMLPPIILIAGWVVGGAGMGLSYPRLNSMTLARSTLQNQGFNTAGLTIAQSIGSALALAATGIIVVSFAGLGGAASFAAVFAFTAMFAAAGLVAARRVTELR